MTHPDVSTSSPRDLHQPITRVIRKETIRKLLKFVLLILLTILSICNRSYGEASSYKIIVHTSNPVSSITKDQASKLFLKKVTKWDNGHTVLPVDLGIVSPVREKFSKEVHGKTLNAIKSYWQQKIFTGRDVPPPEKSSDAEVIAYVQANSDAIGYVAELTPPGNTKVLKITD